MGRSRRQVDVLGTGLGKGAAKAVDSVSPEALATSLRRFGCPHRFVNRIAAIYESRVFAVADFGATSQERRQEHGMCQRCPLSPFLFTFVMATRLHDAHKELRRRRGERVPEELVRDLV